MQRGRADACRLDVLVSEDREDIGCGARHRDVDCADPRMRMRRAHEHPESLIWLRRILDKAPKPAHQRVIFDTRLEMMFVLLGRLFHARGLRIWPASHTAR